MQTSEAIKEIERTHTQETGEEEKEVDELFKNFKKTWTTEELSKEIEELAYHPLFIKPDQKIKETPEILGLQNILYSEDDHTLAVNFSKKASQILNENYLQAKEKEEQVFFLCRSLEKINEAIPLEKNDKILMVQLLSNRSFINGKLRRLMRKPRESN